MPTGSALKTVCPPLCGVGGWGGGEEWGEGVTQFLLCLPREMQNLMKSKKDPGHTVWVGYTSQSVCHCSPKLLKLYLSACSHSNLLKRPFFFLISFRLNQHIKTTDIYHRKKSLILH